MKKIVLLPLILSLVLSCGKEPQTEAAGNNEDNQPQEIEISSFKVGNNLVLAVDGGTVRLPVETDPADASLRRFARLDVDPEGIVEVTALDNELSVKPLEKGSAVVTIRPKYGPGSSAKVNITVAAAIKSISLSATSGLSGGTLTVGSGETIQVKATVRNEDNKIVEAQLNWKIQEGSDLISLDGDGKVTGLKGNGTARIRCEVATKPNEVYAELPVKTIWAPQEIVMKDDADWGGEVRLTPGHVTTRQFKVLPPEAPQDLTFVGGSDYYLSYKVTKQSGEWGCSVQFTFNNPCEGKVPISITAGKVTKVLPVYLDLYKESAPKPGDYIYYKASDGTFRASDCGRRFKARFEGGDDLTPKAPQPQAGEEYIGVLVRAELPLEGQEFLGGGRARSGLPGFMMDGRKYHGLVMAKENAGEPCKWSESSYNIKDKGVSNNAWGHVGYLNLLTYNQTAQDSYKITAAEVVRQYAQSHPVGTSSSGWFLPGIYDMSEGTTYFTTALEKEFALSAEGMKDATGTYLTFWTVTQWPYSGSVGNMKDFAHVWTAGPSATDGRKSDPLPVRAMLWL